MFRRQTLPSLWHETRPLRNSIAARRRRYGLCLSCPRHAPTVAVKILSAHLSENPEAKQRLEREAKSISLLSHPNICHLYDVGQQDGTSYLVMEYLEGGDPERPPAPRSPAAEQALKYGA